MIYKDRNIKNNWVFILIPAVFLLLTVLAEIIRKLTYYQSDNLRFHLTTVSVTTSLNLITFCFFYIIVFPNIFQNKRKKADIVLGLAYWILFGIFWSLVFRLIGHSHTFETDFMFYKASFSHTILSTIYAFILRLSVDWINKIQQQKFLEKQKSEMKLALLYSKINPSFLFKTLNDIDSLCIKNPAKASHAIIKLSEMMRYMLNDTKHEKVLIVRELEHIQNYISFQKLYYNGVNFVTFKSIGNFDGLFIHPMILFTFVENAFRHGLIDEANSINILIETSNNSIYFKCENRKKQDQVINDSLHHDIGIENIEKHLDLSYPDKHELNIENSEDKFTVLLKIY